MCIVVFGGTGYIGRAAAGHSAAMDGSMIWKWYGNHGENHRIHNGHPSPSESWEWAKKKDPDLDWTDVLIYNANHGRSLVKIKWSYDLELNFCFLQWTSHLCLVYPILSHFPIGYGYGLDSWVKLVKRTKCIQTRRFAKSHLKTEEDGFCRLHRSCLYWSY